MPAGLTLPLRQGVRSLDIEVLSTDYDNQLIPSWTMSPPPGAVSENWTRERD